ncbi:MAG: AMP-binding enzyme [Bryobacteraceae bacterium]
MDAAVIGAPDEAGGEIAMAFVVRKDRASLDAAELMSYAAAAVAAEPAAAAAKDCQAGDP